jgi:hypothetical protein
VNKKEAKKTLVIWVRAGENARAPDSKSFLLFFSKKKSPTHRIELTDRTVIGHTDWYNLSFCYARMRRWRYCRLLSR